MSAANTHPSQIVRGDSTLRALLVDNEAPQLEFFKNVLQEHFELQEAMATTSLKEAKEIVNQEKCDLLFLDLDMGTNSNGLSYLMELNQAGKAQKIAICIVSKLPGKEILTHCKNFGALEYVVKGTQQEMLPDLFKFFKKASEHLA